MAAVAVFYGVSGYAMTGLLQSRFESGLKFGAFYRDRLLRLGPQYYSWSLITMVAMAFGWRYSPFQTGQLGMIAGAAIALVIPLGVWMYVPAISHYMPMPQAWSLSTELIFFALFPFLLRSLVLKWAALAFGLTIFCLATANVIDPDYFAYRLLPGALIFFLLGHALFAEDHAMAGLIIFALLIDLLALAFSGHLFIGFDVELFVGGLAMVPLILATTAVPSGLIDRELGAASYGCYLCHWFFLPLLAPFAASWWTYPAICTLSATSGWLTYKVVEEPVTRFRRRLQARV